MGLTFWCRCGLPFQQFTELVEHYQERHERPAIEAFVPSKWVRQEVRYPRYPGNPPAQGTGRQA